MKGSYIWLIISFKKGPIPFGGVGAQAPLDSKNIKISKGEGFLTRCFLEGSYPCIIGSDL